MNARFMNVDLLVERGVIVPREETELLGATALELLSEKPRVIDMCCGSGNLACAFASRRPDARLRLRRRPVRPFESAGRATEEGT